MQSRSLRASAFLFGLTLTFSSFGTSGREPLQVDTWSVIAAEPQSWSRFVEDWDGALQPGGDALLYTRSDVSFAVPAFRSLGLAKTGSLGVCYQRYSILRAHPHTAALYWSIRNDAGLADGTYRTQLRANELISQGLFYGQEWAQISCGPSCRLSPSASVQILRARAPLRGTIEGTVVHQGDASEIDWQVDMDYHEDPLFGRPSDKSWGYGASLDVALEAKWNESMRLSLRVDSALSAIRFSRMQSTVARVAGVIRNFSQIDDDRDAALVNGREQTRSASWKLPSVYQLAITRAQGSQDYDLSIRNIEGIWFFEGSLGWRLRSGIRLGLGFDPLWQSWSFRFGTRRWLLALSADSRQANRMGLSALSFRYGF